LIILMITRPQGLLGSTAAFKGWRKRARKLAASAGGSAVAPGTTEVRTPDER
jgi:hypothetical protein